MNKYLPVAAAIMNVTTTAGTQIIITAIPATPAAAIAHGAGTAQTTAHGAGSGGLSFS